MFKLQICYTEMTALLQFRINILKSHEQHAISAHGHGLQTALRLTVKFSKLYCEL
jgi:hypothetical protein